MTEASELFPEVQESLSPKLAWMKKHGISTRYDRDFDIPDQRWLAWFDKYGDDPATVASEWGEYGCTMAGTQDDALYELAKNNGIKLWNEEKGFI